MKTKNGISLIVLVLTVIVLSILASAVIVSISNTNVISEARMATFKSDMSNFKSAYDMYIASELLKDSSFNQSNVNATYGTSKFNEIFGANVSENYSNLQVVGGELQYKGATQEEKEVLNDLNIGVAFYAINDQSGKLVSVSDGTQTLNIGDTINYKENTSDTSTWRVLGISDKGNLLITKESERINATISGTEWLTNENVTLQTMLNRLSEACAKYGKGKAAVGARSISTDDILKIVGYNKETYGSGEEKYGTTVTFSWKSDDTKTPYISYAGGTTAKLTLAHTKGFYYYDASKDKVCGPVTSANTSVTLPSITNTFFKYTITPNSLSSKAFATIAPNKSADTRYLLPEACIRISADEGKYGSFVVDMRYDEKTIDIKPYSWLKSTGEVYDSYDGKTVASDGTVHKVTVKPVVILEKGITVLPKSEVSGATTDWVIK